MKQNKQKTWSELKDFNCPKCGGELMKDIFNGETVGCACGFVVTQETRNLLVKRDHSENES